jgi:hypothetical protein
MEPEGSLPFSKDPSTGPYPESDQFSPYHPRTISCFRKNYLQIAFQVAR